MIGKYRIIGVCISRIHEEYRLNCLQALNEHACKNGYRLLIFNAWSDLYYWDSANEPGEAAVFGLVPFDKLDAMVLFAETLKNDDLCNYLAEQSHAHNIPVITVDYYRDDSINFSFDYANTFELMCRHVIEDHHVKSAFMMAGFEGNRFSEERVQVFRHVVEENGLRNSPEIVAYGDFWDEPTERAMINWFEVQKLPVPEAIICANDTMAITVTQYLQDHGYDVPKDCIVTGFDGILQASYHIPHITTCTQDYNEMGRQIVEVIERYRQGLPCEKVYSISFHMIKSQSCGCKHDLDIASINHSTEKILNQYYHARIRQDNMNQLQMNITDMSDISELPQIIAERYSVDTFILAVNEGAFQAPDFGAKYSDLHHPFSEHVDILYQRVNASPGEPCTILHKDIVPDLESMLDKPHPIIVCSLHFLSSVMGYCVFQCRIAADEFDTIQNFMSSLDTAMGTFRNLLQVNSVNARLKNVNNELEKLYIHDYLTGLYNRRGFYQYFLRQIADNRGQNKYVVLISLDLDGLKHINDTYGHIEGDNAIVTVSRAMSTSAVHGEICARFGGDEFTMAGIIPKGEQNQYFNTFRETFFGFLENYNQSSHKPYAVESSIGYCMEPLTETLDLDQLIRKADDLMYQNKVARKKNRTN